MPWVMDCSVAAAMGFPDEQSDMAEAFLGQLVADEVWVPSLWWHEIGNVVATARRTKRIADRDAAGLMQLYGELPVRTDMVHGADLLERVHRLSMSYGLSAYDAAYLELAERKQAGLATLDCQLSKAAQACGVPLFSP